MSHIEVELGVKLTVAGPFLCAATGASRWGIDASFSRDIYGQPIIAASHIKGKLREAWRELQSASASGFTLDLDHLLGKENDDGYYEPERGSLQFSSFKPSSSNLNARVYHRIRVENESGTADEGALLTYETPFGSGESTLWMGTIKFAAEPTEVERLINQIKQGLRWITAIGANKGIGFGHLHTVEVVELVRSTLQKPIINYSATDTMALGLVIRPTEPLLIGGLKRKSNYFESTKIISGSVLKGALAACISRKLGRSVNAALPSDLEELPFLSKHFSNLCFQSAFPTRDLNEMKRPTIVPLSVVQIDKQKFLDVALTAVPKLICDKPPAFKLDWKSSQAIHAHFGFASPRMKAYSRTAIEKESRRALEENLFTYVYVCPVDVDTAEKVAWVSNIIVPGTLSTSESEGVLSELAYVVDNWWDRLGKRDSRVEIKTVAMIESCQGEDSPIKGDKAIISLQSDSLIINPDRELTDMHGLYAEYWAEISNGCLQLESFFAEQKLLGGYLVYRHRKIVDEPYYPFFLTAAGSVFNLKVVSGETDARSMLNTWRRTGLPVPAWALEKYGERNGRLDWQTCPFSPENGFGEIKVNLLWHWQKEAK